jgi:hypothetical protein
MQIEPDPGQAVPGTLPFGKHKGRPLPDVPTSYLTWLAREAKLSSGLRAAVEGELQRRGVTPPAPPPPPPPPCSRCGLAGMLHRWMEACNGRRMIRRTCRRCGTFCGFAPRVEPFVGEADRALSPTPILDVLTRLDDLGVELGSDGARVWFVGDGWKRVPADLKAVVGECNHRLARMLGRTPGVKTW